MTERTTAPQSAWPAGETEQYLTTAQYLTLFGLAIALTVVSELIGTHKIGLISLFPLIWGILLGGLVSLQRIRPFPERLQSVAAYSLQIGVLFLLAKLSLIVGDNIGIIAKVGPALVLQELGNLFTIVFALPLAVMLGMGRSAVGACFSICREGSLAISGERYGVESDERRGTLAMYIFGTVFGALFMSLLASLLASTGWFDPLALAMGSGIGSGSMMAAASAAIAEYYPGSADEVLALAATSNLLSAMLGVFVAIYVALPLSERFYGVLTRHKAGEPLRDTVARDKLRVPAQEATRKAVGAAMPKWRILAMITVSMLVAVSVSRGSFTLELLPGFAIFIVLVIAGMLINRLTKLSTIVAVMVVGVLAALPWSPVNDLLIAHSKPISFLPLTTPVLVMAGLGLGKDAVLLRRIGWRIIPIGMLVFASTFIASVVIAQLVLSAS